MNNQSSILVSNDQAGHIDYKISHGYSFDFYFEFVDEENDDSPIDMIAASFTLTVTSQVTGETKLIIINDEWERPFANVVAKSYNGFDLIPVSNYPYAYKLDASFTDGRIHPILKGNIKVV